MMKARKFALTSAVSATLCICLNGVSADDDAARQARQVAAEKEMIRRAGKDPYCCIEKPTNFGSNKRREANALDKDPEGWRVQGPERYPDAVGMEHCQIQRGQLYQMVAELRTGTQRGEGAWSSDQIENSRRLIAAKEQIEKRCCADLGRCEREAREAWLANVGSNNSD